MLCVHVVYILYLHVQCVNCNYVKVCTYRKNRKALLKIIKIV
jgi:hypothetical protein